MKSGGSVTSVDEGDFVGVRDIDEDVERSCEAKTGEETGSAFCAGGTAIRNAATGELAGVGCLDLRSSSSSTSGIAGSTRGDLELEAWMDNLGRSAESCACCCTVLGPTVDTLAVSVEDPETDDGGDGARLGFSNVAPARTGE